MSYFITAFLAALVCCTLHHLRMLKVQKALALAADAVERLSAQASVTQEAIELLELQRDRNLYKQDEQLATQARVKAFIKAYR